MSKLLERLDKLEKAVHYVTPDGQQHYSPCDDIRFKEELAEAYPKLKAVIEAAREVVQYPNPDEIEHLARTLKALEEEP